MTDEQRNRALARLEAVLRNPQERTREEGALVVRLRKTGRALMIERGFFPREWPWTVSLDFGLTCRPLDQARDLGGVLDLILSAEENGL